MRKIISPSHPTTAIVSGEIKPYYRGKNLEYGIKHLMPKYVGKTATFRCSVPNGKIYAQGENWVEGYDKKFDIGTLEIKFSNFRGGYYINGKQIPLKAIECLSEVKLKENSDYYLVIELDGTFMADAESVNEKGFGISDGLFAYFIGLSNQIKSRINSQHKNNLSLEEYFNEYID